MCPKRWIRCIDTSCGNGSCVAMTSGKFAKTSFGVLINRTLLFAELLHNMTKYENYYFSSITTVNKYNDIKINRPVINSSQVRQITSGEW